MLLLLYCQSVCVCVRVLSWMLLLTLLPSQLPLKHCCHCLLQLWMRPVMDVTADKCCCYWCRCQCCTNALIAIVLLLLLATLLPLVATANYCYYPQLLLATATGYCCCFDHISYEVMTMTTTTRTTRTARTARTTRTTRTARTITRRTTVTTKTATSIFLVRL